MNQIPSIAARIANLIVLPHSIFALPFALAAFLIAYRLGSLVGEGKSFVSLTVLVVSAVFFARTAAMAFNRIVDADFDRLNPRTSLREIPSGQLSRVQAGAVVMGALTGFVAVSWGLGYHCLILSPFVVAVILGYSLTKRFTDLSHLVLGLSLALAPGGAWWVLRPMVELTPLLLMGAVLFWVSGFDVLYSCQDYLFDRTHKLRSLPSRIGIGRALRVARLFHTVAFCFLLGVGIVSPLSSLYFLGMIPIGALLIYQHTLVSESDLSKVNRAFFTVNGYISIGYCALCAVSLV